VRTLVDVAARRNELNNVLVLADTGHERDLVNHQLTIFVVVAACSATF